MIRIEIGNEELFDEATQTFSYVEPQVVYLEHSLLAMSKWESKWQIPFLDQRAGGRTNEHILDYIEAMVVDGPDGLPKEDALKAIKNLSKSNLQAINNYLESSESATTFVSTINTPKHGGSEIITSELVYYWMVAFTIPFSCETWNLNRLFALIKICNIKNSPAKKMPRHEVAARNRDLNAERKKELGTSG